MEGKINRDGTLVIKRGSKMKEMNCKPGGMAPGGIDDIFIETCGDDCPHFGEPESYLEYKDDPPHMKKTNDICLFICGGTTLRFSKFTDERENAS
jgi:hypothetical protein